MYDHTPAEELRRPSLILVPFASIKIVADPSSCHKTTIGRKESKERKVTVIFCNNVRLSTMSPSNDATDPSFPVHLAVYDLTQGMARTLSAQFLGPDHALDMIPHTGVIVYGCEYYFGGSPSSSYSMSGIQRQDNPALFRQLSHLGQPIQLLDMGRTNVTQAQFEAWCRDVSTTTTPSSDVGSYAAIQYDLLKNNCNHFSRDALRHGLGLSDSIFPQWILDVPQRFLSSPMGQMLRPMLEQQERQTISSGSSSWQPPPPSMTSTVPAIVSSTNGIANNPWANIAPPKQDTASAETRRSPLSPVKTSDKKEPPRLLDTFTTPLLSSETKMVPTCIQKLKPKEGWTDDQRRDLEQLQQYLLENEVSTPDKQSEHDIMSLLERSCLSFLSCLQRKEQTTFVLLLLRIVVLFALQKTVTTSKSPTSLWDCIKWIKMQLQGPTSNVAWESPLARSAAWLTLSNVAGAIQPVDKDLWNNLALETVLDAALADIHVESQPNAATRQAATSFLYNFILQIPSFRNRSDNELSDVSVTILCSCMEGFDEEPDSIAKVRRLATVGRILMPRACVSTKQKDAPKIEVDALAISLFVDLGFDVVLEAAIATASVASLTDAEQQYHSLTKEVLHIAR